MHATYAIRNLLIGSSIGALCAPTVSYAQSQADTSAHSGPTAAATPTAATAAPQAASGLQEIVVTAERRSESVQRTPIAITAFTADALQSKGIASVDSLAKQTPAFNVRKDITQTSSPLLSIRGLSQNQEVLQYQPSIALYEDGVYAATSAGSVFSGNLFDVERVEVLKGPQGTLFGRNSTGGAVSVISKLPTGDFGGELKASGGSNGLMAISGVVNLPIVGDDVGLRVVGQYRHTDGYGKDITSGQNLNTDNVKAVRATFKAKSGRFQLVARGEYSKSNNGAATVKVPDYLPGSLAVLEAAFESGLAKSPADLGNPAVLAAARQELLDSRAPGRYDVRDAVGFVPRTTNETYGGSVTASYDLTDKIQLKSITAYRRNKSFNSYDSDGSPFHINALFPGFSIQLKQLTEELQLNGSILDDRVKFASGFYFYRLTGFDEIYTEALAALNPTSPSRFLGDTKDVSKSGYAQATVRLVQGLNFTGGLRYTDENIGFKNHNTVTNPATQTPTLCVVPPSLQDPSESCLGNFKVGFTNLSWTAGLDYQLTPHALVYAKASTGFKAGGFNEDGQVVVQAFSSFRPEKARTYEAGVKAEILDRRLRANLAVYQTDFTDIQRSVYILVGSSATSRVENATSARIRGGEFELTAAPTNRIDLNLGLAYINTKYHKFFVLDPVTLAEVDRSGDPFPGVPKWQLNGAASYTEPTSFGSVRLTVDGSYQTKVNFDPENTTAISNNVAVQRRYALANARVTAKFDHAGFEATAFVTNFTDTRYITGSADLTSLLGYGFQTLGAPRMWGIEFTKQF